jgi:hypothetical protein
MLWTNKTICDANYEDVSNLWICYPLKVRENYQHEWVVSLQRAGKYQRPAWRPSQGQKGLDERALMASQRPSPRW